MRHVGCHVGLLAIAIASPAHGNTNIRGLTDVPDGWIVINPPKSADEWRCANYSEDEWSVASTPDRTIAISRHEWRKGFTLPLRGGQLVGTNSGEFGGSLSWVATNGSTQALSVSSPPVAAAQRGKDVFVATGLAHLSLDSGEVLHLRADRAGYWKVLKTLQLGTAVMAAAAPNNYNWPLATTKEVIYVDLAAWKIRVAYENPNWALLYANSLVELRNGFLIGARRAVIRLRSDGGRYQEDWLVPNLCRVQVGASCQCRP